MHAAVWVRYFKRLIACRPPRKKNWVADRITWLRCITPNTTYETENINAALCLYETGTLGENEKIQLFYAGRFVKEVEDEDDVPTYFEEICQREYRHGTLWSEPVSITSTPRLGAR